MSKTILIVDDTEHYADQAEQHFKRNGYETLTADDTVAAFFMYKDHRPDAVLTDFRLRGTTSDLLIENIRNYEKEAGVGRATIVLVSSYDINEADWKGFGADAFFNREYGLEEPFGFIEESLRRKGSA